MRLILTPVCFLNRRRCTPLLISKSSAKGCWYDSRNGSTRKAGVSREYVRLLQRYPEMTALNVLIQTRSIKVRMLHYLYLMADSCIALAELMIKYKGLRSPQTYSEAFDILGANHILDPDFSYAFAKIAGFRNFLAHDYEAVDGQRICNSLLEGPQRSRAVPFANSKDDRLNSDTFNRSHLDDVHAIC